MPSRDALSAVDANTVGWALSDGLVPYDAAVSAMETRVVGIAGGKARELIWLLEHPPLYTAGTSARAQDLLEPGRFPVHATGRGGQYTYHGPGQRVAYVMVDIKKRGGDVRAFVGQLEQWIITTLAQFGITGEIRPGRVGVWVAKPDRADQEDKIAAIGIRVRKWVSFHGISINVAPALEHFDGIVPCGINGHGVTSLEVLDCDVGMPRLDQALRSSFSEVFHSPTIDEAAPVLNRVIG